MLVNQGDEIPPSYIQPTIDGKALEAWEFYHMVSNQWHMVSGMGGTEKIGLNYPTIETIARLKGVKLEGILFSLLQLIEQKILSKERENDE